MDIINYNCKKCGKVFIQKSQYNSHKLFCINDIYKVRQMINSVIEKKLFK